MFYAEGMHPCVVLDPRDADNTECKQNTGKLHRAPLNVWLNQIALQSYASFSFF